MEIVTKATSTGVVARSGPAFTETRVNLSRGFLSLAVNPERSIYVAEADVDRLLLDMTQRI